LLAPLGVSRWCLAVLIGTVSPALAAPSVYIQGSEVNLRRDANTSAELVKKVLIGTECQRLGAVDKKGWVRLRCGDTEGFTLDKLVGEEKPALESLLAQARDTSKSTKERLDVATRAATLDPQSEQAAQLVFALFFDVNFEQLAKDRQADGPREHISIECGPQPPATREQCLTSRLEDIDYDWHQLGFRDGERYVSAMFRDGMLVVHTGYLQFGNKSPYDPFKEEFNIVVIARSRSPLSDTLKAVLSKGARVPARPAGDPSSGGAAADTTALSPESSQLFRSLSSGWTLSQEREGKSVLVEECGRLSVNRLELDIHHRGLITQDTLPRRANTRPRTLRVKSISMPDAGTYLLQLSDLQEGSPSTLTITWPSKDWNTTLWKWEGMRNGQPFTITERRCIEQWRTRVKQPCALP
jgi:hypothetical protein